MDPAVARLKHAVFFSALILAAAAARAPAGDETTPSPSTRINPEVATLQAISSAFGDIAKSAIPSVVSIKSLAVNEQINDELRRMLKDDDFPGIPISGTGSGVILDADGYIVTNNHVVADAQLIQVTLADGRDFKARLVGADAMTDLAVIKIKARGLHPAKFGPSDRVEVGHLVLAIGSPFKFGHSVSHGIISAVGRSDVEVDVDYKNWIQTDAPINPGNSGGPLINTHGQVIGINVAIATESGGYMGVGFAIPSDTVKRISAVLKRGEKVARGYLGVAILPVDLSTASAYGLDEPIGAFIDAVGPDTPAEAGGLEPEDIVLKIDGRPVHNQEQLQESIAAITPGAATELTVWRRGKTRRLQVKVGPQPEDFSTTGSIRELMRPEGLRDELAREDLEPSSGKLESTALKFDTLGLEVASLTPDLATRMKVGGNIKAGAVVTHVDPLGEAYTAQLKRGTVIVRANDEPVRSALDLKRIMTPEALRRGVRLRILRGTDVTHTVLRSKD